jgi:FHS family L-fucose permease-like MFS transporter
VVLGWAILIRLVRFPSVATERDGDQGVGALDDFRGLLGERRLLFGVVGQFFYVGAQVGIWSYLIRYAQVAVPGTGERQAAGWLTLSLALFMAGRFAGAALMGRLSALPLLQALPESLLALHLRRAGGRRGGDWCAGRHQLFMSIMYPTIFAEWVAGLGLRTKSAASLLVMAVIGGAVLTAAMGAVCDTSGSILWAMLVPAGCFLIVLAFALRARRGRLLRMARTAVALVLAADHEAAFGANARCISRLPDGRPGGGKGS